MGAGGSWLPMAAQALWLCWLLLAFLRADTLDVETLNTGPLKGIVNKNITFPCKFFGYNSKSLDLKYVGIRWLRLNNTAESEIYMFNGAKGEHITKRNGSTMLENEIKEGNAALHVTQLQFNEEGRYKCVVFVGASKAEGIFSLEVSALPEASLTPTEIEDESGVERSLSCHMESFYPQLFKIIWKKEKVVISKDICTGYPERNEDGTFTVTSSLRLKLGKEDHQKVVTCFIEHRSFPSPLQLNATLIVQEHEASFDPTLAYILPAVFVFCVLLFMLTGVMYKIFFHPIAPRMTEITGNEKLIDKEKANFSCQIINFRPKDISITVSLQNCIVYAQVFKQRTTITATGLKDIEDDALGLKDIEDDALLMQPQSETVVDSINCKAKRECNVHRTCSLCLNIDMVPNIQKCNRIDLCVTVEYCTLTISKQKLLNIVGVPPMMSDIMQPHKIVHQENLTLQCSITGFKPRPLTVTWVKKGQSNLEEKLIEYTTGKNKDNDGLKVFCEKYSHTKNELMLSNGSVGLFSVLIFVPTFEVDNGTIFLCKTHHHETKKLHEKSLQLFVTASPMLDQIHAVPDITNSGDTQKLSCRIHSFFPPNLNDVNWHLDGEEMYEGLSTSDVISGPDGLYSCTSSISFSPRSKHNGKTVRCSVAHDSLKDHRGVITPKETTWKLTNLICYPKQIEITCDPADPEQGKSVTLSCVVQDYYPDACEVKWFQFFEPICTATLEEPELYKETDLYRRRSQITFTPTAQDHDTEYSVEVTHCNRILRRTYRMILKDFPIVKEITLDPVDAVYGEQLTLSCEVTACDHKDMSVTWFQKEDPILKGDTFKGPTEDCASIFYQLQMTPTAAHYNQAFICNVKHRCLPRPIIKRIHLPLKQIPPVVSDISMRPAEPEVNKTVFMTIKVSNFSPKEIKIRWYKGWMEILKEMVTNKDPQIGENNLYVATSTAEIIPTQSDNDTEIRCEVHHSAINTVVEKKMFLNLKGLPTTIQEQFVKNIPKLSTGFPISVEKKPQKEVKSSEIECLTSDPKAGDTVRLKCFVPGCCAGDACTYWSKGAFPIDDDYVENLDCDDGSGYVSIMSLQTQPEDRQCEVRCETMVNYIPTEKKYVLKLY